MVGMLAITAAAGWLLRFLLVCRGDQAPAAVGLRRGSLAGDRWREARAGEPGGDPGPHAAAYPATILDLAAKGHLMITQRMPGQLWCDVPAAAPADTGLAQSERLVLADARWLATGAGRRSRRWRERCASDVRGKWDPFGEAVRAEGRGGRAHPAAAAIGPQVGAADRRWVPPGPPRRSRPSLPLRGSRLCHLFTCC